MLKRNPIIAAVMVLIVLAITVWGVFTVFRSLFYNPVEKVDISRLPDDALKKERQIFSEFAAIDRVGSTLPLEHPEIGRITQPQVESALFGDFMQSEVDYQIHAETQSALDPLKDEVLRNSLWELMDLKQNYRDEVVGKTSDIYYDLSGNLDAYLFKSKMFGSLSNRTLEASLNQPAQYPLRQAEVKQDYYRSMADNASLEISGFHHAFDRALKTELKELRNEHESRINEKVLKIRDYLRDKTSSIQEETIAERTEN